MPPGKRIFGARADFRRRGDTILVLPHDEHQFMNAGRDPLRFLCAIPLPSQPPK
jgi:quercetin dioxygenase-like cupin family protein